MSVLHMPLLPLDASGYPVQHALAKVKAGERLMDLVNDCDGLYHLTATDADWIVSEILYVYLHHCRRG